MPDEIPDEINLAVREKIVRIKFHAERCPNRTTALFIISQLMFVVQLLCRKFEIDLHAGTHKWNNIRSA